MGNCLSDDQQVIGDSKVGGEVVEQAPATLPGTSDEKPKPLVFAIMRNGHEVIRGAMVGISEEISLQMSRGDRANVDKVVKMWNELHKWEDMHKLMEDGSGSEESPSGMFRLLDKHFDGLATKNGLLSAHTDLDQYEDAMNKACSSKDILKIKAAFHSFEKNNLEHLENEEKYMMPKVMALKKNGADLTEIMKKEIFALIKDSPDLEFFIKFANSTLDKHHGDMPRARVFDHALWAIATDAQWQLWDEWIQESLTPLRYAEIQAAIYPEKEQPTHSYEPENDSDVEVDC